MKEIWKDICGYENRYQISNLGNVKSLYRKVKSSNGFKTIPEKQLKLNNRNNSNYLTITLRKCGHKYNMSIHRLVAQTFIPNPNNFPVVNHIDGNKKNNCVSNLEWCTQSHNVKESYKLGLEKPTSGCFKKGNIPWNKSKN